MSGLRPFHLPLNLHFIRPSVFLREAARLRFDDLENELCLDSDISRRVRVAPFADRYVGRQ